MTLERRIQLHEPHAAQQQVLDEAQRFNVVACGRRWGKSDMCLDSLAIPPMLDGWPVGWFAPTYMILADAWNHCITALKPLGARLHVNKQERRISVDGAGYMEFWSTEPKMAGEDDSDVARSRHYKRIIYDEAARARRLKADWTKAILPTLADLRGDAWFPSTPKGQNYFHVLWRRGQTKEEDWASWRMPTSTNPLIAEDEIAAAKRELPADAFEQEYLAQFLANAANPFGINAIHACVSDIGAGPVAHWGVDLAKSVDWTVAIGLNEQGQVCAFQRWQSDWRNTGARLMAMLRDAPALVDATGVGNPIVEQLQSRCPMVEGYTFTSQSKQQLMEGLAWAIQNKSITFPEGEIVNELETFQYEYRPSGVRYTAPDGLHDDCVCALSLAVMSRLKQKPAQLTVLSVGDSRIDPWASDYSELDDDRGWS